MDKTAFDQSEEEQQTPKSSGPSSTVLNILKRFRSRREDTVEIADTFDERLGSATGPLAERISEISSKIEAGRAKDAARASADAENSKMAADHAADGDDDSRSEETTPEASGTGTDEKESRSKPRIRAMGFHNPVFPVKTPDETRDPDFKASTEPPPIRLHDAPEGVMENFGAPEKRLTPPKEKHAEPLDLKVFAEHIRSKLPKPEPKPEVETGDIANGDSIDNETAADAAAFKKQFFSRISNATAFDAAPLHQEQNILHLPSNVMNLGSHDVTASSALRKWRDFQSAGEPSDSDTEAENLHESVHAVDQEAPVEPQHDAPTLADSDQDANGDFAAGYVSARPDWPTGVQSTEDGSESELSAEDADDGIGDDAHAVREAAALPESEALEQPEPEVFSDLEMVEEGLQATEDAEPENMVLSAHPDAMPEYRADGAHAAEPATDAPPENVFAALNIDEDEILMRVYDLVQSELQAAWGENITLNIRKIVRDEVRAAVEKARSESRT